MLNDDYDRDVDVRDTRSYIDVWERDIDDFNESRFMRFQITDDHYLLYYGSLNYKVPDTYPGEDYVEKTPQLSVNITPPKPLEGANNIDYEVTIFYDKNYTGELLTFWQTATPAKTDVLSIDIEDFPLKLQLKFVVKGTDFSPEKKVLVRESWFKMMQGCSDVTLVGNDGEVGTKMELLKDNSEAFKAMFDLETSIEYQTKRVDIKEYSEAVLKSFVHFLATHEVIDGKNTACDLLLLADKYNIADLKSAAEKVLLSKVDSGNARKIFKIFYKVSPELLEKLFVKTHGQQRVTEQSLAETDS